MNSENDSLPVEKKDEPKAYRTPQLVEYGNIQQLTQAVGPKGNPDGGGNPKAPTMSRLQ